MAALWYFRFCGMEMRSSLVSKKKDIHCSGDNVFMNRFYIFRKGKGTKKRKELSGPISSKNSVRQGPKRSLLAICFTLKPTKPCSTVSSTQYRSISYTNWSGKSVPTLTIQLNQDRSARYAIWYDSSSPLVTNQLKAGAWTAELVKAGWSLHGTSQKNDDNNHCTCWSSTAQGDAGYVFILQKLQHFVNSSFVCLCCHHHWWKFR